MLTHSLQLTPNTNKVFFIEGPKTGDSGDLNNELVLYINYLNTVLVGYLNSRFVSGCQMVRYSNCGLKTGLKEPVYGPTCLVLDPPSHV